ncbi:hypothetical protein [Devosia alba]|uniref:hypothetical protein n=1 Tax=Devosia alba TaxID=3152360 RepID=UPI003264F546
MGAALLKDRNERQSAAVNYRLNDERWSDIASSVRSQLTQNDAFKTWEAEAITDAMIDTVREFGTLVEAELFKKLHARQFSIPLAKNLAHVLTRAFG